MSTLPSVRGEQFAREVLQSDVPVLVDFYATWCPPCRALAPTLEQLAVELVGQVRFVQVNVDEEGELADKFRIQAIPALLVFQGGQLVEQFAGLQAAATLRRRLQTVVARSTATVR